MKSSGLAAFLMNHSFRSPDRVAEQQVHVKGAVPGWSHSSSLEGYKQSRLADVPVESRTLRLPQIPDQKADFSSLDDDSVDHTFSSSVTPLSSLAPGASLDADKLSNKIWLGFLRPLNFDVNEVILSDVQDWFGDISTEGAWSGLSSLSHELMATVQNKAAQFAQERESTRHLSEPDLVGLGLFLGGENVRIPENRSNVVQFSKVVVNPKTQAKSTRYYALYQPGALLDSEVRALKATLKIGNPRSYGVPPPAEEPKTGVRLPWPRLASLAGDAGETSLTSILRNNYVITIRNSADSKFGALAVVHADPNVGKGNARSTAYIGQVVNGPRDPAAGESKPPSEAEKLNIVGGGGSEAVKLAIRTSAYLGHSSARLYTNRPSLGERTAVSADPSITAASRATFYDKVGLDLGLDIAYSAVEVGSKSQSRGLGGLFDQAKSGSLGAPKSMDDKPKSQTILLPEKKVHYHYTYSGLERLRNQGGNSGDTL